MSCANSVAAPSARSCARSVLARLGVGYPSSLALLWPLKLDAAGVLKSAKGPAPTFTDTPTLSAGGVVPGDGPSFTDVVTWTEGGTLVVEFTATTASADLVGDVQVFGPVYASSAGLKAKDGTNTASVATSWGVGDVVTVVVQARAGGVMYISLGGPEWVMKCDGLVDTVGTETRQLYASGYVNSDGSGTFVSPRILGNETVIVKHGTSSVTITAGVVTIGAGTLWSLRLSNGAMYEVPVYASPYRTILRDVSGNGYHLTASGFSDYAVVNGLDATGTIGADWVNQRGATLFENLLSGHPTIKSGMACSAPDADGFYTSTKTIVSTSGAYLLLETSGVGRYAATTSRYVLIALRALASSPVNQVEIGWDMDAFAGHTMNKLSGPGTLVAWSGIARVTGLSETEDTVILLKKSNFTVGADVGTKLKIWPGSATISTIGAGCRFRNVHIGDGIVPRGYTSDFDTPYILVPKADETVVQDIGNVVVIGDSIAFYLAPHAATAMSYASIINKGVGGHRTSSVLSRFQTDVVDAGAKACVLICGINDVMNGIAIEVAKSNYEQCIDLADANGIEIILATLPPIYGHATWTAGVQTWIEDFDAWVKTLGKTYVDLYRLWGFGYNYFATIYNLDNLHPNDSGRIVAAKYIDSIMRTTSAYRVQYDQEKVTSRAKYNITDAGGGLYKMPDNCPEVFKLLGTLGSLYDSNGVAQAVALSAINAVGADWVIDGGQSAFDYTMPALTLAPDCPGKLKQVQEWKKVASAREIGKY